MPGYEQLQEGLAVFAEYLVGGLSFARLRTLAARVIAVRRLTNGHSFAEVFNELHKNYKFGARSTFNTVMRVFRGGGLTKDAVYLRGLVEVLKYIGGGGDIETLFVGKMGPEHVSIIRELQWREVLRPSPLDAALYDVSRNRRKIGAGQRKYFDFGFNLRLENLKRRKNNYMRIGFVVNDVKTEHPRYTTTRIARAAREMGHEAWTIGVGDFAAESDDQYQRKCANDERRKT